MFTGHLDEDTGVKSKDDCAKCARMMEQYRRMVSPAERSVPTKITDTHWIASGGMGDPTP